MEYQVYADYFNLASQLVKSKSDLFIIPFSFNLFLIQKNFFLGGGGFYFSIYYKEKIKWKKKY